jgi:hypothetical protein
LSASTKDCEELRKAEMEIAFLENRIRGYLENIGHMPA